MQTNWKKNIAIFLASQGVSLFGSMLVQYAIAWHINLSTGSGTAMTIAILCGFLPTLLLSPFAGVWADRYDRKLLAIFADGGIAAATLVLALLVRTGNNSLVPMYIALAIRALGNAVQQPCVAAILPSVVPEEHLMRVNGVQGSMQSVIMLFSPMLAALLIRTVPFYYIFFIDIITAVAAILILLFVFRYKHEKQPQVEKSSYLAELKLGLRYIGERSYLKILFLGFSVFMFLVTPLAFLSPLLVSRTFGGDALLLMGQEICYSVGMVLGGVLIAAWGGFRNRVHTMLFANIITACACFAMGLPVNYAVYLILNALCGMFGAVFNAPSMALMQERIEDEYMGRVFSVMNMLSGAALPLGMLVFGPLADKVSIQALLLLSGALMLVSILIILTRRSLVEAGEPKASAEEA